MRKELILFVVLLLFGVKIFAASNDTIWTKYNDGIYFSEAAMSVDATFDEA